MVLVKRESIEEKLQKLVVFLLMLLVYTICMVICGNGARMIIIAIIMVRQRMGVLG